MGGRENQFLALYCVDFTQKAFWLTYTNHKNLYSSRN